MKNSPTCSCDVCLERFGPGDAVTAEGYCGFCARYCFPWAETGPYQGRQTMTLESRQELHRVWDTYGTLDAEKINSRAALQVGLGIAQTAAPILGPYLKNIVQMIGKKLR